MAVNACATVQRVGPATQDRSWRAYLGSAERAAAAPDSLNADPRPVWRTDVGRGVVGAPALTEDLVVVSQPDRQVTLLERSTGDVVWRHRLASPPGAGPLVDGDRILVATQEEEEGRVLALRLDTGAKLWSAQAGDIAAPLALDDSTVYAASTQGWVAAFRIADGSRRWRTHLSAAIRAAPLPTPEGLVVATTDDSLFLLDAARGTVRARSAVRGDVLAAPALAGALVVVGTTAGALVALSADGLVPRWSLDLGGAVVGAVAVQQGAAWALTVRGTLWRVPLAGPGAATHLETGVIARAGPLPTASGVFVADVGGELVLVDATTGARTWSFKLRAPLEQPPAADGRFFLAVSGRGEVVAFR